MSIDLAALKEIKTKLSFDSNEFFKQICEVQPMPNNIISDLLDAIGDKTFVITSKESRND